MPSRARSASPDCARPRAAVYASRDVDDAPLAAQPVAVLAAVARGAAVVDVDDADAPAGEERLLQREDGKRVRRRAAVHVNEERRELARRSRHHGTSGRVDDGVHHASVRAAGKLYRPRVRQVGRVGSGDWLSFHQLDLPGRGDAQHAPRGARAARHRGDRRAGDRELAAGGPVAGQLDAGQFAGDRVEHAEVELAEAVQHREPSVAQQLERPPAELPERPGEFLGERVQRPRRRRPAGQAATS